MTKRGLSLLCALLLVSQPLRAWAEELVAGGQVIGVEIASDGVLVAGMAELETAEGSYSPAERAGLKAGDRIVAIGDTEVKSAADFLAAVAARKGAPVPVSVVRCGKLQQILVQPVQADNGQWLLGMWLRDCISGIGTLTFVDPATGLYGALGHGVSDENGGGTIPIRTGHIAGASVSAVQPGTPGKPGELTGGGSGAALGAVERNAEEGIFGHMSQSVGTRFVETGEMSVGAATILSTVRGTEVEEFTVEINRVYRESDGACRAMLTVTDPTLIALTGGIVQGMSGSPILQEGKLVGAVTHVFVST